MKKGIRNGGTGNVEGFSYQWLGYLIDFNRTSDLRKHLSTMTGLSSSQVDTLTKRIIGTSFKELMLRLKLIKTLPLVPHSGLGLGTVARSFGFATKKSFVRSFTRIIGVHPMKLKGMAFKRKVQEAYN